LAHIVNAVVAFPSKHDLPSELWTTKEAQLWLEPAKLVKVVAIDQTLYQKVKLLFYFFIFFAATIPTNPKLIKRIEAGSGTGFGVTGSIGKMGLPGSIGSIGKIGGITGGLFGFTGN
jgi:hypothetical protein